MNPCGCAKGGVEIGKTLLGIGIALPVIQCKRKEVCDACEFRSKSGIRCKRCGCLLKFKRKREKKLCEKWPE